ncbi:hypothetical protein [Streptomyces sp. XD-27]|uniref:hypothetical protein n=1 Tax=Streptomyces sp. XD-27 TaxID=3062779 RepID=UPI0026F40F84|nr:hypothetical protein [Streptomyces sp. XD-27]WKX72622.1 hypothetical protein Q3Y56_24405 [Streptomyces sp. XD-27]
MKKRLALITSAAALSIPLMAAVPAQASTVQRERPAPACMNVDKTHTDQGYKAFKVKNGCREAKKVKGKFKWGYDSSCKTVKPGKTAMLTSSQPWVDYDKVVQC